MSIDHSKPWLYQPLRELPFSSQFKKNAEELGYNNLDEILYINVAVLKAQHGFTNHMILELVQFLEDKNATDLLREA